MALLVVVVVILFLLLNWYVAPKKPGDRKDLVLAVAQILGGTALLSGLYFTWRTIQVNREGQITDRFTRAIDQLGKVEDGQKLFEIRIGGIYALERIARESDEDYWPIMEVLTAYVRKNAPLPPEVGQERTQDATDEQRAMEGYGGKSEVTEPSAPDPDIQAIMTILRRRKRYYMHGEPERLDLSKTNLSSANLSSANLTGANFSSANLTGADLTGVDLSGANLREAIFYEADLLRANFSGADLLRANFSGAGLVGVNFSGADLTKANFSTGALLHSANFSGALLAGANLSHTNLDYANFSGAGLRMADLSGALLSGARLFLANLAGVDLRGADLEGADLREADLREANLRGANLEGADLEGADLSGAKYITKKQIEQAYSLENATMPKGQKYEEWLKSRGEDGGNSSTS